MAERIILPATGVHVLPFLSSPTLQIPRDPNAVVVEMTPLDERWTRTEALCRIPMLRDDALRLAILIANHAATNSWPLPGGLIVRQTIQ
jgi:hypothetical protein